MVIQVISRAKKENETRVIHDKRNEMGSRFEGDIDKTCILDVYFWRLWKKRALVLEHLCSPHFGSKGLSLVNVKRPVVQISRAYVLYVAGTLATGMRRGGARPSADL
jgi:protein-arginine kinase